jgi:hypothetical protein
MGLQPGVPILVGLLRQLGMRFMRPMLGRVDSVVTHDAAHLPSSLHGVSHLDPAGAAEFHGLPVGCNTVV